MGRATMQSEPAPQLLYNGEPIVYTVPEVSAQEVAPGVVPTRLAGRKPKCFFAMLKAFLGTSLMGFASEPEKVYLLLSSNPSFARVCGFALSGQSRVDHYQHNQIPSLRKLEQFDQVMRQAGLWGEIKVMVVTHNLNEGIIEIEPEAVGDTTHYHAYSGFETVVYEDENGKERKKSQSKPTKSCRCQQGEQCDHPWELRDDGAGTIVKSGGKMYWGHKASVIGFPRQGVALDAIALSDAASHDGKTFLPHLKLLFETYPDLSQSIKRALYDSACDDQPLKEQFSEELGIELKASLNPRRKKAVTDPTQLPGGG